MKTIVLSVMLCSASVSLRAQGTVNFANDDRPAHLVTNFCTLQPVVAGTTFMAALYFAPDGTLDESQFQQLGPSTGFVFPGIFSGGTRTAPVTPIGAPGLFQVKVWETAFGSTYEEALAAPPQNGRIALLGKSTILRVDTADPLGTPQPSPLLPGLQGIYVGTPEACVPEPSTIVLSLLGPACGLILRRAKVASLQAKR